MKNRIINMDMNVIRKKSEAYFCKICGFDKMNEDHIERIEEALELRNRYQEKLVLQSMVSIYGEDCIQGHSIQLEKVKIETDILNRIDTTKIKAVVLYAMSINEIEEVQELDMLEKFYLDTWMTSLLDAGRDCLKGYLQDYLKITLNQSVCVTDSFGPGFYDMGLELVSDLLQVIDGKQIGIELSHGAMKPAKSNIGFYLALSENQGIPNRDCKNCLSNHMNCLFCKNYK